MIKLKKIVNEFRNPFSGELYEGLIRSVDVDDAIKHIERAGFEVYDSYQDDQEFRVMLHPEYPDYKHERYVTGHIYDKNIDKLFKLANNLGYMPTFVRYGDANNTKPTKYTNASFRDIVYDSHPEIILITFNRKFDEEIALGDLPKYIYHLTQKKYAEKIKAYGFKPSTKSKLKNHPERIYFSVDVEGITVLKSSQHFDDFSVIIVVNTELIPDSVQFYTDPDFIRHGIYTHDNISKNCIKKIQTYNSLIKTRK